jgi:hypothetical protein
MCTRARNMISASARHSDSILSSLLAHLNQIYVFSLRVLFRRNYAVLELI